MYQHLPRYISTISPLTLLASGHARPSTCSAPTPNSILALSDCSFPAPVSLSYLIAREDGGPPAKAATWTTAAMERAQVKNGVRERTVLGSVARFERRSAARRSLWEWVLEAGESWWGMCADKGKDWRVRRRVQDDVEDEEARVVAEW